MILVIGFRHNLLNRVDRGLLGLVGVERLRLGGGERIDVDRLRHFRTDVALQRVLEELLALDVFAVDEGVGRVGTLVLETFRRREEKRLVSHQLLFIEANRSRQI